MWLIYALLSSVSAAGVAILGKIGLQNVDSTLATTLRAIVMAVLLVITSLSLGKLNGVSVSALASRLRASPARPRGCSIFSRSRSDRSTASS